MADLALYRAFRPQTFDDVVAQRHVVLPLRESVKQGQITHALLFAGTRGTGKTSLAKIYAKAVNCLAPVDGNPCNSCEHCQRANAGTLIDILEMDAASNNSVDTMRKLIDEVVYAPVDAAYKVYIIDEAHMLSKGAFNALLKTLEDPPAHAIFILATTEAHMIPMTITSRCQRFDFRRIPLDAITSHLRHVADVTSIAIDDAALVSIATLADGALRDAISLLDQVRLGHSETITRDDVLERLGETSDTSVLALLDALAGRRPDALLETVDTLCAAGRDVTRLALDIGRLLRLVLVIRYTEHDSGLAALTEATKTHLRDLRSAFTPSQLIAMIEATSRLASDLRHSSAPRLTLDIALLALCHLARDIDDAAERTRTSYATPSREVNALPSPNSQPDTSTTHEEAPPSSPNAATSAAHTEATTDPSDETTPSLLDLLTLWDNVLHDLSAAGRLDLHLMAKSADVAIVNDRMRVSFGHHLLGAYQMVSRPDAVALIASCLKTRLGRALPVDVVLSDDDGGDASAEDEWLLKLRETHQNETHQTTPLAHRTSPEDTPRP